MEKEYEYVEHPSHYNREGKKECIVLMEEIFGKYWTGVFCVINAFKYRYRAGDKPDESTERDLEKAKWYLNRARTYLPEINIHKCYKLHTKILFVEGYDYGKN